MRDIFSQSTPIVFPKFEEKLRGALPDLPRLEAQVAQYMILNVGDLSFETGVSISEKVGVSEVTVSRLLRRLGYRGMRGLKRELRDELFDREPIQEGNEGAREVPEGMTRNMDLEYQALGEIYQQRASPLWGQIVQTIVEADRVYVTGFQAVRGMAEDCARRLGMTRGNVRFLAAHDGMLTEWLKWGDEESEKPSRCLILIDVVPYAREASILSGICSKEGHSLIVFTDEMCHWARNYTDLVIYASTRTGLILESTVAITAALNLMVNSVAGHYSTSLTERLDQWKTYTRALRLF
ncbi:MAG: MurR/RpiR family transcriptional regulator [Gammaproteobacteria bacterium]|nr:MurR/RpiR family transcriptional regulator [Gammaproteobacteria bacterium]MDE0715961.1 MurR/RpiR family transcriptional regulator [Gammaproteobacteria bacterium]MYG68089.1 MurR/RpiR family transcriptional regulator [Gammaproteobacteria bacterium]MYH90599.1 MurR/RpiR family transcriptional regulator [Gammaproteobacteria bacterium]